MARIKTFTYLRYVSSYMQTPSDLHGMFVFNERSTSNDHFFCKHLLLTLKWYVTCTHNRTTKYILSYILEIFHKITVLMKKESSTCVFQQTEQRGPERKKRHFRLIRATYTMKLPISGSSGSKRIAKRDNLPPDMQINVSLQFVTFGIKSI